VAACCGFVPLCAKYALGRLISHWRGYRPELTFAEERQSAQHIVLRNKFCEVKLKVQ
jgi:uncharacterized protein YgiB involved in biofilm formation